MQLYKDEKKETCVRKAVYNLLTMYDFQLIVQGKDFDGYTNDNQVFVIVEYQESRNKYNLLLIIGEKIKRVISNRVFKNQNEILKEILQYI